MWLVGLRLGSCGRKSPSCDTPQWLQVSDLSGVDLPAHRVTAANRRINEVARSLRGGDETWTMDQLRADVLLDLLIGADHSQTRAGVVDPS